MHRLTRLVAGALLSAAAAFPAAAGERFQNVTAEGDSGTCWSRSTAMKFAHSNTRNDAQTECRSLGAGWSLDHEKFSGYEQCRPCGSNGEVKCAVTQAVYVCVNRRN